MPDILASLTKEQRKELADLRVNEKKWKEDRRKKTKKNWRDANTDERSDEDRDGKEKRHRPNRRSHKSRKRVKGDARRSDSDRRRKHHYSDSTSSDTSSESDHGATGLESREVSRRKYLKDSEDSGVERAAGHERHQRRHRSPRAKDKDHDHDRKGARDTILDEVQERFTRQRKKGHRRHRHDLPTG